MTGNIIHASSTNCKRVTRAVLASGLYAMVAGIDMLISLATTIDKITDKLGISCLPTVVCTDSLSTSVRKLLPTKLFKSLLIPTS